MTMVSYISIPTICDDGSISYSRISLDDFAKNYSGNIGILATVASDVISKMSEICISVGNDKLCA
jgi:hypothetical protein